MTMNRRGQIYVKGLILFKLLRAASFLLFTILAPVAGAQETPIYGYRIINVFPHDPNAFTQGLFFSDGYLYESTGQYGESSIRKVDVETGKILKIEDFPEFVFGEGITLWDGQIIGLSWRNNIGFRWDFKSFQRVSQFRFDGEGWGLSHNGQELIMSDGTPHLRFIDPVTMTVTRRVEVTARGAKIPNINELEWISGILYANIWQSNYIAQIDPENGVVDAWINLNGLLESQGPRIKGADVLNGIADAGNGHLYVTGKRWPYLFEIEILKEASADH